MTQRTLRFAYLLSLVATVVSGTLLLAGLKSVVQDAVGPNRLIVPLQLERSGNVQLFYDRGAGITEQHSVTVAVGGGGSITHAVFALPRVPLQKLRFDPPPGVEHFSIGAPHLETATGRLVAQFPLTAVVSLNQIEELQLQDDLLVGLTRPHAADPQLEFGLGSPLRIGRLNPPYGTAGLFVLFLTASLLLARHSAVQSYPAFAMGGSRALHLARSLAALRPATILFGGVLVGALELWWLWPLHRSIDFPLWDESNYAAFGANWFNHGGSLGEFHSSPLYLLSYGVFSVPGHLEHAIFAQHYFVKLCSVVLLYLVLTKWWRSWIAGASVALLWGATQFHLEFPLLVYQFAFVWVLAGLVVVDRWPLAGLGFIALASCVRQEYQIAATVFMGCLVWRCWRSRNPATCLATNPTRASVWTGSLLAGALLATLGFILARTEFRNSDARAWFAFQQHYAVRAVATGEAVQMNPWIDYPRIIQKDFPGASSVGSAWRINRQAMVKHIRYNLVHVADEIVQLAVVHPHLKVADWLLSAAAALAFASSTRGEGLLRLSTLLACAAIISIVPGLLVLAKGAYLLPLLPALIGAVGACILTIRARAVHRPLRPEWSVAVLLVAGGTALAMNDVFEPQSRARPVADTVAVLRQLWPHTGKFALLGTGASSYAHYLGDDRCLGVEPLAATTGSSDRNQSLDDLVRDIRPLAILVTDDWKQSAEYHQAAVDKLLTGPSWTRRTVPTGELYLRQAE